MITVIDGLTGSGKTWLMSRLLLKRWKEGENIYPNLSLKFPNNNERVARWYTLSETYALIKGVIAIDEGQKLFDAHLWPFLPPSFAEKIASHRHEFLDIYTTTQDFGHIDIRVRENVHDRYTCVSMFRFPKRERYQPIFQLIRTVHKTRLFDDTLGVKWTKGHNRYHIITKLWTRELYDTHANINLSHFICQIKREKKKWIIKLQSRQLLNSRRIGS